VPSTSLGDATSRSDESNSDPGGCRPAASRLPLTRPMRETVTNKMRKIATHSVHSGRGKATRVTAASGVVLVQSQINMTTDPRRAGILIRAVVTPGIENRLCRAGVRWTSSSVLRTVTRLGLFESRGGAHAAGAVLIRVWMVIRI